MNNLTGSAENIPTSAQFPVIGIGASAGGLEAIKDFVQAIPEKSGMAYVFVQHLNPEHPSALAEILGKLAKIPVKSITDDIDLETDHFYIVPENKIVATVDGKLKLSPLDKERHKVKVIDLFFSSLAVVHQSFAVGVVLSGTLNDGTLGLQVIKAYGGITFAQDEGSATYQGMPKNAVNSGAVDFIMAPAQIVQQLLTINNPFHTDATLAVSESTTNQKDEDIYKQLLTVLRVRKNVDFGYYKSSTLKRRIMRRMALNNIGKPAEYLVFLRENRREQDDLYNDMLISVTSFFRDPPSFKFLSDTIIPSILEHKNETDSLRIWVAGCATGEEAYSLAIAIQEHLGEKTADYKIQIFATDISEIAIAKARTGIYSASDVEGISAARLQQYFNKIGGSYHVSKSIREMCVFAHHNFLKDPPFSKVDLISCRNVMIYLEPVLQKRALNTFHYALNDQGILVLGKSETIGQNPDLFVPYTKKERVYLRAGERGRYMPVTTLKLEQDLKIIDRSVQKDNTRNDIFKTADELVLSQYAPAGVLVNDNFDIIQFRGNTESWLTLTPGKASLNVIKMAREGLAFEIRSLLQQVKKTGQPAKKEQISFFAASGQHFVHVDVSQLHHPAGHYYLILFQHAPPVISPAIATRRKKSGIDPRNLRIEQLEKELSQIRADMRMITEEQEVVNEELQSANMELLSSSEELQSVNEELETSKEELQSTNEEIVIVNNELQDRNEQLNAGRIYAESIMNTIRDPLILLDKNLIVKRATYAFYKKFRVSEKDTEGQYLYDLGEGQWNIPALRELLEKVLPQKKMVVDFEVDHVFPDIGHRVMLLNTQKLDMSRSEQFIILAIEDITDKRKVE